MCLPVAAYQSRPVDGKYHMQVLDTHIMQHLVICPLQEGRIHGNYRGKPRRRQSCRKRNRMRFRDAHVKKPVREHIGKPLQPRAVRHRCRDSCHIRIPIPKFPHHRRKNIRIVWFYPFLFGKPRLYLKRLRPMKPRRMAFCRDISLSFFRKHMYQYRAVQLLSFLEYTAHLLDIVPVHRSQIRNSHVFKQHSRNKKLLDAVLCLMDMLHKSLAIYWNFIQNICNSRFQPGIRFICPQFAQIRRHASHIFRNGHIIIIQDDNKIRFHPGCIIQRLVRHPSRQGTIADN